MICTSIQNKDFEGIMAALGSLEMAEIRLDRCALSDEDIDALFNLSVIPLVATCRMEEEPGAPELLERAIAAGAKYVDLEMEVPAAAGRRIKAACSRYGTILIRSAHLSGGPYDEESLLSIYRRALSMGAELVKIVVPESSGAALAGLYSKVKDASLIAFALGEGSSDTRIEAIRLGAPFTYASLSPGEESAPGQIPWDKMKRLLYGSFHFIEGRDIKLPSSKSFAQRAILAAALAKGVSRLGGYSPCEDSESAVSLSRALGAKIAHDGDTLVVEGIAAEPGSLDIDEVNVGESGLLARMAIPILATLAKGPVRVSGEGSILKRPLSDAHDIMAAYGVRLYPIARETAPRRKTDACLPLTVTGPIYPGRADVSGRGGSQLISGLLGALPLCGGKSILCVQDPRSIPYLFITQDVLGKFGVRISSEMEGNEDFAQTRDWSLCEAITFMIKGGQRYRAASFDIEACWSGAAALLTAGAIFGDIELLGLDSRSLQADISILDILVEAGASISQGEGATPGTGPVRVKRAPLNAFEADLNNCPDLFPIVSVLAAFCPGESVLHGVERLRFKETDRAAAIEETLTRMGVPVSIEEDIMRIKGMALSQRILCGRLLKGGVFSSYGDHRMLMAIKVASLGASSPVVLDNEDCVCKSFPSFNDIFKGL